MPAAAGPPPQGGSNVVEIMQTGLIPAPSSGRADAVTAAVPADSYVVPADIVSALGDGNTAAGGRVLDAIAGQSKENAQPQPEQKGISASKAETGEPTLIRISGGEYVFMPADVAMIGFGDIEYGHDTLDEFVKQVREQYSKKIKDLPGPRKE